MGSNCAENADVIQRFRFICVCVVCERCVSMPKIGPEYGTKEKNKWTNNRSKRFIDTKNEGETQV